MLGGAIPQDLKKLTGGQPLDTVIHDGAPNIGGVWTSEAYTQSALVLDALRLGTETLAPGGTFVTKIFRRGRHLRCHTPARTSRPS